MDGEKREGRNIVIRTRKITSPMARTNPHAVEMIDFLVIICLIILYMDIHLVKRYLDTFFLKSSVHIP